MVVYLFLFIIILLVYYLIKRKFNYWNRKDVPHSKPTFFFGNYKDYILMKRYSGFIAQDICRRFPNEPYIGTYYGTEPALLVQDPEIIKLVMSKDFNYFNGREITNYCKCEPITRSMFFNGGDEWKILRQNLTLLFSSAKMKKMFYLIQNCRDIFEEVLRKETTESQEVEAKSLATRYIMDCIGSCVFGINTEVMTNNVKTNIFAVIGAEIFNASTVNGFRMVVRSIWPSIFYGLRLQLYGPQIQNFFHKTLTEVFESRQYKETSRHDFVDLIMSWKNNTSLSGTAISLHSEKKIPLTLEVTNDLLLAQCVLFFAAGFETSSTTVSLGLYELAKNKDAQRKLIQEVDEYLDKNSGKIDFEAINELPYLQACLDETMRLYPLLGILTRETMHDYTLPTGLRLEKGVRIHIPIYNLHHDPKYFPEPEKFIPERFYGEAKKNVTPYTYLPFGEGPRICIERQLNLPPAPRQPTEKKQTQWNLSYQIFYYLRMRFSKMQIVPAFLTIFKDYEVDLMEGMPTKLDFAPGGLVTQIINGIHLKFNKRNA